MRGWAGTTIQAVEMRPLAADPAGCEPGVACYRPISEQTSVVGTQDVSLTAWGFGVRGLSATMYLRGRADMGSDFVWPRSDDHFDALLAYAQWQRSDWSVRLGRQEIRSGLGFASFDGGTVGWRTRAVEVEGYAGRSLARGLRDPANKALEGIEDFVPDQGVHLFGGAAGVRLGSSSANIRYQREILADRSGLASERASLDGSTSLSRVRLVGGVDWDFGRGQAGKGHITASMPVGPRWLLSASARRYVPYFSLSTIWGFFEPVAYHEATARAAWSPSSAVGVWLSGGWRKYGDTETVVVFAPLEDTGWRGEAGGTWSPASRWTLNGGWRLEWGPGGFLNSGDASVRWDASTRLGVTAGATTFQQIEEYRLGDGRALGGSLGLDIGVTERIDFTAGGSLLRHTATGDGVESPWNQARAWSTLRIALGGDPGPRNRVRR